MLCGLLLARVEQQQESNRLKTGVVPKAESVVGNRIRKKIAALLMIQPRTEQARPPPLGVKEGAKQREQQESPLVC